MSECVPTISVSEYLNEQKLISQTAQQVAEAAGEKIDCCSHDEGYVTQSVFICSTCTLKEGKMAGFCFGCSMNCHLGHEVHELWTKRNFCCDCGNDNYVDFACTLCPKKNEINKENKYSQNFKGLYCYCRKKYDPEVDDDMHQCTRCEDWFHHSCIEYPLPAPENTQDLLCQPCAKKCSSLMAYRFKVPEIERKIENGTKKRKHEEIVCDNGHIFKKRKLNEHNKSCSLKKIDEDELKEVLNLKGVFFPTNWTESLCTCTSCKNMYKEMKMEHIFEENPVDINGIQIDHSKPVSAEFDKTAMGANVISGLPNVEETNIIIDHQRHFHNLIKEELGKHIGRGEITEMKMKDIIRAVKMRCEYERNVLHKAPPNMF